jgi:hypothetical protein
MSLLNNTLELSPAQQENLNKFAEEYQKCLDGTCPGPQNWLDFWKDNDWQQVRHIITKHPHGDQYVNFCTTWLPLGSCDCNSSDGNHPHKHYIVYLLEEYDDKTRKRQKYQFYKQTGLEELPEIKLIDNIITPNCFHHAVNMCLYPHKRTGVRKNAEHIHTNPKSVYLGTKAMPSEAVRTALMARAFYAANTVEKMHQYPPFMFNKNLVFDEGLEECPCAQQRNRFCKIKVQTRDSFLAFRKFEKLRKTDKDAFRACVELDKINFKKKHVVKRLN